MKNSKVVGCLICGFRTTNPVEIERFKNGDFFCCNSREEIVQSIKEWA